MSTLKQGTLGDANLIYPPTGFLQATVTLGFQPTRITALLRGFEVGFAEGDRRLSAIAVNLEVAYAETPGDVVVKATASLSPPARDWSPTSLIVHYTLLAD